MTMTWSETALGRRAPAPSPLPAPETTPEDAARARLARLRSGARPVSGSAVMATEVGIGVFTAESAPWELADLAVARRFVPSTRLKLAGVGIAVVALAAAAWATWPHGAARSAQQPAVVAAVSELDGLQAAVPGQVYGPPLPALSAAEALDQVRQSFADAGSLDTVTAAGAALESVSPDADGGWARTTAPPAAGAVQAQPVTAPSDGWSRAGAAGSAGAVAAPPSAAPVAPIPAPRAASAPVIWPAAGPITSYFGPVHPLGIDIGINSGTPLRAVANGRIAFVGGDACCSYGYYIDIDHGNGVMTRYGHMLYVPALPVGGPVRQGDIIGVSGNTGFSTGPHLHFEVRLYGRVVDPLLVLP